MKTVNSQHHSWNSRNSHATQIVAALFVLLLAMMQGVLAQSTNGFAKSGALTATTTTNGIIRLQPLTITLPDHTLAGTATANTLYPLPAVESAGTGSADTTAAAGSPTISTTWAQRAAARLNTGDDDDRNAQLKWIASH